jgi:rhodanese-related sulfurtransferase
VTTHASQAREIGEAELATLANARPIMLDVRERADFRRGHRAGAVNIPADELNVRGWIEIDRSRPVVIDCSQTETPRCQIAARRLIGGPKPAEVLIYLP